MRIHPPARFLSVCPSSSPPIHCFSMERGCVYPEYVCTQQSILQSLPKPRVYLYYHAAPCRDSPFHLEKCVVQLVRYSPVVWKSVYAGYSSAAVSSRSVSFCPNWGICIARGQHVCRQAGRYVHLSKPGASCLCLAKPNFQKLQWSCTRGATTKEALSRYLFNWFTDFQVSRDHCNCHEYTYYLPNVLLETNCASNTHSLCIHHSLFFFYL